MEHFVVLIDNRYITTVYAASEDEAKSKTLSSHPGVPEPTILGTVTSVYSLIQPFIAANLID